MLVGMFYVKMNLLEKRLNQKAQLGELVMMLKGATGCALTAIAPTSSPTPYCTTPGRSTVTSQQSKSLSNLSLSDQVGKTSKPWQSLKVRSQRRH